MESKRKAKEPVIDFDVVRAMNEYIDDTFLNKALQSLRGGNRPDAKDIITYKINNTNYLANLYQDTNRGGGKKSMLLDSIFKVPENFSLSNTTTEVEKEMEELDLGGARPKNKTKTNPKTKTPTKKKEKKKGGSDLYEIEYSEVEELGGESKTKTSETLEAVKKKPGRKPKK